MLIQRCSISVFRVFLQGYILTDMTQLKKQVGILLTVSWVTVTLMLHRLLQVRWILQLVPCPLPLQLEVNMHLVLLRILYGLRSIIVTVFPTSNRTFHDYLLCCRSPFNVCATKRKFILSQSIMTFQVTSTRAPRLLTMLL